MEITFFFNLPMTALGAFCVVPLLEHVTSASAPRRTGEEEEEERGRGRGRGRRLRRAMLFYASLSLLTLMHYAVEPPPSYAPEVNFTIAGEGVAMLVLALVVWCMPSSEAGQLHVHVEPGGDTELEVLTSENGGEEEGNNALAGGEEERVARTTAVHMRRRSGGGGEVSAF
jgi:hypothetical protein